MSMISGQVDRLRTAAQTYRRLGNHTAEGMFLEAADTICELQAENAKLRELVRDMAECMDDSQPRCKKCKFRELNCQWFKFDDRMRELGVGVDA